MKGLESIKTKLSTLLLISQRPGISKMLKVMITTIIIATKWKKSFVNDTFIV